jgi:hypothetical protein
MGIASAIGPRISIISVAAVIDMVKRASGCLWKSYEDERVVVEEPMQCKERKEKRCRDARALNKQTNKQTNEMHVHPAWLQHGWVY